MSPNNPAILYAGQDVAKATLQFHLCGIGYCLENTRKEHARIVRLLAEAEATAPPGTRIQVVLEATGGYEAALVAALHAAERPVSVIQPSRARHFAGAQRRPEPFRRARGPACAARHHARGRTQPRRALH